VNTGIIVALISLILSIITMFAHLVRTVSRIEMKVDEMWTWFIGAARDGIGRRRTDRILLPRDAQERGIPRDDEPAP